MNRKRLRIKNKLKRIVIAIPEVVISFSIGKTSTQWADFAEWLTKEMTQSDCEASDSCY
jgi:hypothetical protein